MGGPLLRMVAAGIATVGHRRRRDLWAVTMCVVAQVPVTSIAGIVCKYRKYPGRAYMSATNWIKAETEERARKLCDAKEECVGYHIHPFNKMSYLYREGTELVEDPSITDFVGYKKRVLTCEGEAEEGDDEPTDEEAADENANKAWRKVMGEMEGGRSKPQGV